MKNNEEFKQEPHPHPPSSTPSRLAISFGPQTSKTASKISLSLTISKEESQKQLLSLSKSIKNKLDPNYALIFEFNVLPINQPEFLMTLKDLTSFSPHMSELNSALNELINTNQLIFESFLDKDLNKVFLIIKLGTSFEEVASSQMKLFTFLGLDKILKETKNTSFNLTITTQNTLKTLTNSIKTEKTALIPAILEQIALELSIQAAPTLIQDLCSLIDNMGLFQIKQKGFNFPLILLLMKKLKSFDIDLQLESSNRLDQAFKGRFLTSLSDLTAIPIDIKDLERYKSLMRCVEGEVKGFFTIGEVFAAQLKVDMPGFMVIFDHYSVGV